MNEFFFSTCQFNSYVKIRGTKIVVVIIQRLYLCDRYRDRNQRQRDILYIFILDLHWKRVAACIRS